MMEQSQPGSTPPVDPVPVRRVERMIDRGVSWGQSATYLVIAVLLLTAGAFTLVGTIVDLVEGRDSREIADAGVFLLDRILLLFIIGELLYTLRLIDASGKILAEPFLFIGLIAVVRRVLVIAAEVEGEAEINDFLIEIAALAGLTLVLIVAIYLLRRSASLNAPRQC
jgi:uncharacterized membrane protein (DUF373 family)